MSTKVKLASSLGINSTSYAGEAAAGYIAAAMLQADSIERGLVTVVENVKYKHVLRVMSSAAGLVRAYSCDFDNNDDLDIDEKVLTLTELMVAEKLCKSQFLASWDAMQTGAGRAGSDLPASFEEFLLLYLTGKIAESTEYNLWQGNYDPSGTSPAYTNFNGICKQVEAASSTVKVDLIDKTDGSTQITTLAVAEDVAYNMQRGVDNLPAALKGRYDKVKIHVSPSTYDKYFQDLATQGLATQYNNADAPVRYNGYSVERVFGFPDDTILLASAENLFFGTDLLSDFNQANVVDTSLTMADDNVRVRIQYACGTQIAPEQNIVMVYPDAA